MPVATTGYPLRVNRRVISTVWQARSWVLQALERVEVTAVSRRVVRLLRDHVSHILQRHLVVRPQQRGNHDRGQKRRRNDSNTSGNDPGRGDGLLDSQSSVSSDATQDDDSAGDCDKANWKAQNHRR